MMRSSVLGLLTCSLMGCGGYSDDVATFERGLKACPKGETLKGIDVSKWQGDIDWFSVASDGVDFAFIRVSDGLGYPDPVFQTNWKEAHNVGIVRGVYQFFRPGEDPVAQAQYLLEQMGPLLEGDLPPVIDVEVTDGQSDATIVANMQAWLDTVENALGVKPIIYTSPGFWAKLDTSAFGAYPLWVAHWGTDCPTMPAGWTDWIFWQTSDSGSIKGISGNVDLDLFNGDLNALKVFGIGEQSCEATCQSTDANELEAIGKINQGWIGGSCGSDADCAYAGGFCVPGPAGYSGMCSQACDKFCPDELGMVVTFCVEGKHVGVSDAGACVAKCDHQKSPTGCRPGYACVDLPRFNDPGITDLTCIPNTDPHAIDPFAWSYGHVNDDCSETPCALDFGQVCTEDGGSGPHCAFAVCLEPETFKIKAGVSCSYLGSESGTSVVCDDQGKLLSSEECTPDTPCNACGTCGIAVEVCDGKDNDCDGEVDEGVKNACGTCGDVPVEVCDGADNDCDGEVDEGLACDPVPDAGSEPVEPGDDVSVGPSDEPEKETPSTRTEVQVRTLTEEGCQGGGAPDPGPWIPGLFLLLFFLGRRTAHALISQ